MNTTNSLKLAKATAREAGSLLREAYTSDAGVISAVGKDIKTLADYCKRANNNLSAIQTHYQC